MKWNRMNSLMATQCSPIFMGIPETPSVLLPGPPFASDYGWITLFHHLLGLDDPEVDALVFVCGCGRYFPVGILIGRDYQDGDNPSLHVLDDIGAPVGLTGLNLHRYLLVAALCDEVGIPVDGFLDANRPAETR